MSKAPDAEQLERLRRIAGLPDEQIDTSDLTVIEDWSQGIRGGTPQDVRRKLGRTAAGPGPATQPSVEGFIARWQGREGGQERANYALFLSELCDVLGVARPDPASATTETNDYVFERVVHDLDGEGGVSNGASTSTSAAASCWKPSSRGRRAARKRYWVSPICSLAPNRRGAAHAAQTAPGTF